MVILNLLQSFDNANTPGEVVVVYKLKLTCWYLQSLLVLFENFFTFSIYTVKRLSNIDIIQDAPPITR